MKYFLAGFILTLLFAGVAFATRVEKITWCHCEPNGNCETLELPERALSGHRDANGNPLHAGDHLGACIEATPTPCVTITPTPTIEVLPTVTPTATPEATLTPTQSTSGGSDNRSDGRNDGLGCGSHDCNTMRSSFDGVKVGWK